MGTTRLIFLKKIRNMRNKLYLINMGLSLWFGAPDTMKHNGIKYIYLYYYQSNKLG